MRRYTDRTTTRRFLLAASFGLTSSLLATTTHAGKCNGGKTENFRVDFKVQDALPFVGYRCIRASHDVIHDSDDATLPSARSTSRNRPASDTRVGGNVPKATTTDISEEKAL